MGPVRQERERLHHQHHSASRLRDARLHRQSQGDSRLERVRLGGSRPQLPKLEVFPDSCTVEEFAQKVSGQHRIVACGNHVKSIRDFCAMMDIELVVESTPKAALRGSLFRQER